MELKILLIAAFTGQRRYLVKCSYKVAASFGIMFFHLKHMFTWASQVNFLVFCFKIYFLIAFNVLLSICSVNLVMFLTLNYQLQSQSIAK